MSWLVLEEDVRLDRVLFSSNRMDWGTPQDLFDELNKEFDFTFDPCATVENAKCKRFATVETNGLVTPWTDERVFMNPPYGREISRWMEKASTEVMSYCPLVVCLVPSRTDTRWWHSYVWNRHEHTTYPWVRELRLLKGRLTFEGAINPAPFPSAIVVMAH